jgi:transposase
LCGTLSINTFVAMATAVPPFWKKKPEVEGVRATLERLFDQGEKDELLKVVVGMLGEALSRNDELTWRLQAALKLLGRKKSERISKEQLALFLAKLTEEQAKLAETPETEVSAETPADQPPAQTANTPATTPAATPKTPHKKPFPDHLRREVVFIPVSDDKRVCDECGEPKSPMGYDTQAIWEFKPAEFFIREERLEKVVCKKCEAGVVTAEGTPKPIDRGRPGAGLLAQIVVSKLDDSSPLYRQTKIYERSGIRLAPSTIGDWFARAADLLEPLAARARQLALGTCYLLSLDDTGMPVLDHEHPKGIKRGHIWTYIGDQNRLAFCEFTPSWDGDAPCKALAEFKGKVVQGDGYAGINAAFVGRSPALIRAGCMDHCRRKFVTALEAGDARAAIALHHIGGLYAIEADARSAYVDLDELGRRRRELAKPVMLRLHRAIAELHDVAEPKSPLGKATFYAINQWDTLSVYLDDPRIPISNAHVERNQRKTALTRKNALFAGSDEGGKRLATLLTILTNCWLHKVPTFDYLRDVLAKLVDTRFKGRLDDLLPHAWLAARAAASK